MYVFLAACHCGTDVPYGLASEMSWCCRGVLAHEVRGHTTRNRRKIWWRDGVATKIQYRDPGVGRGHIELFEGLIAEVEK
jgi:hypothetical protein